MTAFYRNDIQAGSQNRENTNTVSFVTSVCPSVRMEQLGTNWKDFHELGI
jgi:hypothetical protein